MTLLVTKSHPLEARTFSTPMQALAYQFSSCRSTALTRSFCVLLPTSCASFFLRPLPKNEAYRSITSAITDPSELDNAQTKLFHIVQFESFPTEKKKLLKNSPLGSSSRLLLFSHFIGPQGLLRATSRTKKLDVSSFDAKHPIYLTAIIQLHACSSKTYTEPTVIRVWTT